MSSVSKPEKYCKISTFLSHNEKLLHDIIDNTCLFGVINGNNRRKGVTLLIPPPKVIKEWNNLLGTNTRDLIDIIKRHISYDEIDSCGDIKIWDNAAGEQIDLKDYKITENKEFKRLYETGSKLNVYNINKQITPGVVGAYSGGNDDYKKLQGGIKEITMGYLKMLCATTEYNLPGIAPSFTAIGVSLLNWLRNGNTATENMCDILCKVHPVSPLYWLFILPLLNESEIRDFLKSEARYNKVDTFKTQISRGIQLDESQHRKYKRNSDIHKMTPQNAPDEIKNIMAIMVNDIFDKNTDFSRWGGKSGFIEWMLAMNEVVFVLTPRFIEASANKNKEQMEKVCEVIEYFVIPYLQSKEWSKCVFILDNFGALTSKEKFCTQVEFLLSSSFFTSGANPHVKFVDGKYRGMIHCSKRQVNELKIHTNNEEWVSAALNEL